MKENKTKSSCLPSNTIMLPDIEQIREQAKQKAKSAHQPDLASMTHEEIQRLFYEMQSKQIESELYARQLRIRLEQYAMKAELLEAVDAISAHLAIINETGTIIAVNKAWERFARYNTAEMSRIGIGINYFDICDNTNGPDAGIAAEFAQGMRAVLAGEKSGFIMEYPCHSDTEKRWFVGRVTRFFANGGPRLVVAHENITIRKQAEEELENFFEVNLDLLCIADVHGNFIKVNREWKLCWDTLQKNCSRQNFSISCILKIWMPRFRRCPGYQSRRKC